MRALNQIEDFLNKHTAIKKSLYSSDFNSIMTQEKLEDYLAEVKENLLKYNVPNNIRKKCYGVIVEALENVMKHGSKEENYNMVFHKFEIGDDGIELSFGNYVPKEELLNLQKHLELIEPENDNLKELIYTKAGNGKPLSNKGGAGIGIFDMAVKSKGRINHIFLNLNSKDYFLTMIKIT